MASQSCRETPQSTMPVNAIESNRKSADEEMGAQHSDSMQTQTPSQFQLLALPKEVRLMIYERLPRQIKHTRVPSLYSTSPTFILTRHLPLALLRTCRTVYAEADSIVKKLIQGFIVESRPKVISIYTPILLNMLHGVLVECTAVQEKKPSDLESIEARQTCANVEIRGNATNQYRFFHQAALFFASKTTAPVRDPYGNLWVDRVHVFDLEKYEDVVPSDEHKIRKMAAAKNPSWRYSGYLYVASPGQYMPSRDNIPELRDTDNKPFPAMTEETWVREWLPLSDS